MKSDKIKKQNRAENESLILKYEKPVLRCFGDVRDITLGPTPGLGESGNEFVRCPLGGPGCA